jgi:hypothetical protein
MKPEIDATGCYIRLLVDGANHTEEMNMSKGLRFAAALAGSLGLATALAGPAAAQGGLQVGTLTCNASGAWGFIFGSSRDIACTQGGVLLWTVVAPTAQLRPGDLAGTYGGATASATVGFGIGANALIGGSGNTIALQPVSIETNRGLNVAAGVAAMSLVPAR